MVVLAAIVTRTMTPPSLSVGSDSASVRASLVVALRLDLVGPWPSDTTHEHERLPQAPSRWYLTGFLAPNGAPEAQRAQDEEEVLDGADNATVAGDDSQAPERASGKRVFFPSSMGLSVLVEPECQHLTITLSWGDYTPESKPQPVGGPAAAGDAEPASGKWRPDEWQRQPRSEVVRIDLTSGTAGRQKPVAVPGSGGLEVTSLIRDTKVRSETAVRPARAVSVFLVNNRPAAREDHLRDTAFAFQVDMTVEADRPLVARFDPRGFDSDDWDERLADLHYRDVADYAVGHNVSTRVDVENGACRVVHSEWMPQAAVPRVISSTVSDVEFSMEALGSLPDASSASRALEPLVGQYRDWIGAQEGSASMFTGRRREVADELHKKANKVADRIQRGIELMADPDVLMAFRIANRAMAAAARRRQARESNQRPEDVPPPQWRPFQLAYILMNLRGVAEPTDIERDYVDLLFFPTGGGKTEAYLGLAAFTLVLRRLRNRDPAYRGLSVLMRYTLRLLTLDQLGRAAALVCALELERETDAETLGTWPFEIALWVGRAATPNRMGRKGDRADNTARSRVMRYARDSSRDPPLPLDQCPWCGTAFGQKSYQLRPDSDQPEDLRVRCVNRYCDFSGTRRFLPIVSVDEPIYRRLPAFMIATSDKFAALPWSGETAGFFRGGDPEDPRPPDLIIQDELHLISGPLGTMAGLYETAIDHLCTRKVDGKTVRPKIFASTATVRLAQKQIRALFNRTSVTVFPPPGVDRRDSFFAHQYESAGEDARLYLGIAAQGRGPKVIFLRSMITTMAAAQAAWEALKGKDVVNPADPYMTTVAYFNALRELGSARRLVEDEVRSRLLSYAQHKRIGEETGLFGDRRIATDPVELTSRVGTGQVAEARRRLALGFHEDHRVDVALATNMISVGLDIARLGLMVVSGQPKTTAEYIQATSRVGRDPARPGLVVTLLNIHRPRDRSHYEQFTHWHESFYREVEATSVTPFSPRALDRGLPAVAVAMARLGINDLTPADAAALVEAHDQDTRVLAERIAARAREHRGNLPEGFGERVRDRAQSLFDDWASLAEQAGQDGEAFVYAREGQRGGTPLLREMIDPDLSAQTDIQMRFRAPRSLRDVEPGVLLGIKSPEGRDLDRDG